MKTIRLTDLNDPQLAVALSHMEGYRCLVALAGTVGAGKTRYRKRSGLNSYPHVDVADYLVEGSGDDHFEVSRDAKMLAMSILTRFMQRDTPVVVYEATNMTEGAQTHLQSVADTFGYKLLWVWVEAKYSQCKDRLVRDGEPNGAERLVVLERITEAVKARKMRVTRPNNHLLIHPDGSSSLKGDSWAVWQPVGVTDAD